MTFKNFRSHNYFIHICKIVQSIKSIEDLEKQICHKLLEFYTDQGQNQKTHISCFITKLLSHSHSGTNLIV